MLNNSCKARLSFSSINQRDELVLSLVSLQFRFVFYSTLFVHFALKAFLFNVLSSCLLKTAKYRERYKLCYHWSQSSDPFFPCTHAMHGNDISKEMLACHHSFYNGTFPYWVSLSQVINPLCLSYSLTINKMPVYSDMSIQMRFETSCLLCLVYPDFWAKQTAV